MNKAKIRALAATLRRECERLLAVEAGTPTLSNRLFGPGGIVAAAKLDPAGREALAETPAYTWVRERMRELRAREVTAFERETEALSGRMTLVVPRSLHAALKREARNEGVSLAELLRLKVSVPYRELTAWTSAGASELAEPARK